jgi:transposase
MTHERERQPYDGALNLLTQDLHWYEAPTGHGVNPVADLQGCQTLYPDKPFVVLWDGASYHRGEEMPKFLAQANADLAEAEGKVTCVRFAPHAPEPHPTEDVWRKGKTPLRKQLC